MKIYVGIATKGRPEILAETLKVIQSQERLPDKVVLCPAGKSDLPGEDFRSDKFPIEIVTGPVGSSAQRNAIIAASQNADVLLFLDDDFFMASYFISNLETLFKSQSDVVIATGEVAADGIGGPGFNPEQAKSLLRDIVQTERNQVSETYSGYGCNMAVRMAMVSQQQVRFDEKLPLYAWQEDVDFSRQLSRHGRVVKDRSLNGIHLGHRSGRSPGLRLGYSQVANPIFLFGKGTVSFAFAARLVTRNGLKNILRFPFPEPYVDRRGRLKGNLLALLHLMQGKLDPERILKL